MSTRISEASARTGSSSAWRTSRTCRRLLAYRRENADHFEPFEPVRSADHFTEAYLGAPGRDRSPASSRPGWRCGCTSSSRVPGQRCSAWRASRTSSVAPLQSCFLGYALAESQQGKGLMTERAAARHRLHVRRDEPAPDLGELPAAQHAERGRPEAPGLHGRGVCPGLPLIDGRWQDHILTSLLNSGLGAAGRASAGSARRSRLPWPDPSRPPGRPWSRAADRARRR